MNRSKKESSSKKWLRGYENMGRYDKRRYHKYLRNILAFFLLLGSLWVLSLNSAEKIESQEIKKDVDELTQSISEKPEDVDLLNKLLTKERGVVESIQNEGIKAGLYDRGVGIAEDGNQNAQIVELHYNGFCNSDDPSGLKCQTDPLSANGDIKFSTLISGSKLDQHRSDVSELFVQYFIQPDPPSKFKGGAGIGKEPWTNAEVYNNLSKYLIQQSLFSVAREPFAEMIGKRSLVTVKDKQGNETKTSIMSKMEQQASQRFMNQGWYDQLKKDKDAILATQKQKPDPVVSALLPLFEITTMEAYRTWLEFERYKQGERIEALLSGILVELNKQSEKTAAMVTSTQNIPTTPTPLPNIPK